MPQIPELIAALQSSKDFDTTITKRFEEANQLRFEGETLIGKAEVVEDAINELRHPFIAKIDAARDLQSRTLTGWFNPYDSASIYHNRYALPESGTVNKEWYNLVAWLRFISEEGSCYLALDIRFCSRISSKVKFGQKVWRDIGKDADHEECFQLGDKELVERGLILTNWLSE